MSNGFSWTEEYRRTWDDLQKDTKKNVFSVKKSFNKNRKNIIRHLLVALDTSESIEKADYVPTVRSQLSESIPEFIKSFTATNPLSRMSFLTCNESVDKISNEYSPKLFNTMGFGEFSMLNCLRACLDQLKHSAYTNECLIITASIGTKDSGIYSEIFEEIKKSGIVFNIISICGEVTLFKKIAGISNGKFMVPFDVHMLNEMFSDMIIPNESVEAKNSLVPFGLPNLKLKNLMCACHLKFSRELYECPKCNAPICSLPMKCPFCDLHLISPTCILQSYKVMYPLKPFRENVGGFCQICNSPAEFSCEDCSTDYCSECNNKVHEELDFCLFCN